MSATPTLAAGLHDTVHETQAAFRQVLDALSRPGQVRTLGPALPGVALGGAMARLLLSLSDDDTPILWHRPAEALAPRCHPARSWPVLSCAPTPTKA